MTLTELTMVVPALALVAGWIWHAARLAQQIRQVVDSLDSLHTDLRQHVSDENVTFEKIHTRLNDHHAGLARIEGRLQRNGISV